MLGEKRFKDLARKLMKYSDADQKEVVFMVENSNLTRFANNTIHQNVSVDNWHIIFRAVYGKRIGVVRTNVYSEESFKKIAQDAKDLALIQAENPDFKSLPEKREIPQVESFDDKIASLTAKDRASFVKEIIATGEKAGCVCAGFFSDSVDEMYVANSLDVKAYASSTSFASNMTIAKNEGSGYNFSYGWKLEGFDPAALAKAATKRCLDSQNPVECEPGVYTVVMEPEAVGGLLEFLAYLGFGAKPYQEQRSFSSGKIGSKIMHPSVSIWDDGLDPRGLPFPFDFEGMPKQKVMLVEEGVLRNVVYDSLTAGKEGKQSTGHALPADSSFGPFPLQLFMKEGDSRLEEMVASTEKGIYISRFHYTNVVEPISATITGMTRDGTFLIKNGSVTKPIKNMRFTQSLLEAFSNVENISRKTDVSEYMGGSLVNPAVKLNHFTFTGKSK